MLNEEIKPRFSELDGLGHINNTTLPVWFEHARTPLFEIFNPNLELNNWNLILKKMDVEFVAQIFYGKNIVVKTWVEHIGNSSFVVQQQAWQQDKLVAKGSCVMIYFNYKDEKTETIPDNCRTQLEGLRRLNTDGE